MSFNELKKFRNLVVDLIETLANTWFYLKDYCETKGSPLPTEDRMLYLIQRAIRLCEEINEEVALPPNLQHRFRTPKDSTEPSKEILLFFVKSY